MAQHLYLTASKVILLLIIACACIWLLGTHKVAALSLPELYTHQCQVEDSTGNKAFNVYVPTNWQAAEFGQALCRRALKGTPYQSVTVSWQPRESITSQAILTQHFDAIWIREHALSGLTPDWNHSYRTLIPLPSYPVYLFSHSPGLTLDYSSLAGLRFGLLADSKSFSGYLALMDKLNQLGVSLPAEQTQFYPSRQAMIDAFIAGELDAISGADFTPELAQWPETQKRVLTHHAPMGN
ncbi:type 2 periplasmic-binding domain-containing protein [Gilvimarinus agarilyticus]|uniref:hypothetical protein n=1 Tax=Gilvimarinus agarilyticus TaxID=679259 RepID=UPI00069803A0|nr:hypothetical protein [Gilvimarinus agarilyticus]